MNPHVSPGYLELLRDLHNRKPVVPALRSHRHAEPIMAFAQEIGAQTILDYGCGQGTLGSALVQEGWLRSGLRLYDPAVEGHTGKPLRSDLVCSTDVLEHVEPEMLDEVLSHIRGLGRKGAYLHICTQPGHKVLADGRNAHLIVEDSRWWMERVYPLWRTRRVSVRTNAEGEADVTFWLIP